MAQEAKYPDLRALRSDWLKRVVMNEAMTTFEGKRDVAAALGYADKISPYMYRQRYLRNAVAARVVEAKPQSTWRGGGELIEVEDPQKITDFEKAFDELNLQLNIWPTFYQADVLAGLGRYAVIFLGASGLFDRPLTKLNLKQLQYLTPFSEEDAAVTEIDTDMSSPRFGQPLFYNLKRIAPAVSSFPNTRNRGGTSAERKVHWTRIIHIADGILDDHVYGLPRLERVWNLLDDLDKVTGGGAEAFWKRADQGLQADLDQMVTLDEEGEKKLKDEFEEYTHGLRRILRTRGMKITPLGSDVASFQTSAEAVIAQISAGTGIPQRILMGSERGHLASTQDRDNWAEQIHDRRQQFAEPGVVRPFINRLIDLGVLPKPRKYSVRWPLMKILDDMEKAEMGVKLADMNQKQGEQVITSDEIRDRVWGIPALKEKIPVGQKIQPDGPQNGQKTQENQ